MVRQDKKKLTLHLDDQGWKVASRGSGSVVRSTRKLRSDQSSISKELRQAARIMADTNMDTNSDNAKWEGHIIPGLNALQSGFPKSIITKLRYADILTLNPGGTTTPAFYNYRPNSIFDPDQSGIGHQPMFFDNYAQIYGRYRVLGSSIKVVFTPARDFQDTATTPQRSSFGGPWIVGINGTSSTASYSSVTTTRMEANDSVYKTLNTRTGADGVVTCELVYSPEMTLGRPNGDDTVSAAVSANPTGVWYWQVYAADTTGAVASTFVNAHIDIDYTVEFYQINDQSQN